MTFRNYQRFVPLFLLLLLLCGVLLFISKRYKVAELEKTIEQTSYDENNRPSAMWPLTNLSDAPGSYVIRVVIDPKTHIGYVEYQGLVMRAWNIGSYKDINGNIQQVAIPRMWEKPTLRKVHFLSYGPPKYLEGYSDKFLISMVNKLTANAMKNDRQLVATILMAPTGPDTNQESIAFYKSFSEVTLPESFIKTGNPKDLPSSNTSGRFLPVTQILFSLETK